MTRAQLLDLAARVEAATGADRALDAEIMRAAGWQEHVRQGRGILHGIPYWRSQNGPQVEAPLNFTASRDAAATLAPEGWVVAAINQHPVDSVWHALLEAVDDRRAQGEAHDEPRARTAAALRALAEGAE